MQINLSWDLFVIVFFTVIIAYSFIIGRNQTTKIIISSYIAILASDGIGNMIQRFFFTGQSLLFEDTNQESSLIVIKIFAFIFTIVMIATRGRFTIDIGKSRSPTLNMSLLLTYGFLCAGLIISTILIYTSGSSLVEESRNVMNEAVLAMYRESKLVQLMINNYNLWFSMPAIAFVLASFVGDDEH